MVPKESKKKRRTTTVQAQRETRNHKEKELQGLFATSLNKSRKMKRNQIKEKLLQIQKNASMASTLYAVPEPPKKISAPPQATLATDMMSHGLMKLSNDVPSRKPSQLNLHQVQGASHDACIAA